MILIFDPSFSALRWCNIEGENCSEFKCEFSPGWFDRVMKSIGNVKEIEAIGYVLYHGGEIIRNPVEIISLELIKKLEQCVKFDPERNDLTLKIIMQCIRQFKEIKHILLCDTAFFADLPEEVSTYAVPYELREKGIRRYGRQGLSHQWAWVQTKALAEKNICNAISVYLGNHTNMVAIKKSKAQETSVGFTSVEGIISTVSCGDIDPTVIFQMHSTGMSFRTINSILSQESGFKALLGKKSSLSDILSKKGSSKEIALREIYCYNILKYLGGFISSIGGVDTLIFIGEDINQAVPFIREICCRLRFLGLKLKRSVTKSGTLFNLTTKDSPIKVFCLKYNKWKVLAYWAKEGLR
ncbi:MAG: hypothetical protein KJ915_09315 [Candidatus Omnitrophica bacterium]|nr:hypothetical protein [Candidatus Omnitrophota bacterium]